MGARVFAPATVANLAVGYDILGLALDSPGDEVEADWVESDERVSVLGIEGDQGRLPTEGDKNTASVAAASVLNALGETRNLGLRIFKNMPAGSGLGSSAASAVAGAYVANLMCGGRLSKHALLEHAAAGEAVASGAAHLDNVAPSMLGGMTLVRDAAAADVIALPVPAHWWVLAIYPHVEILTREARAVLSNELTLEQHVAQLANSLTWLSGVYDRDDERVRRSFRDSVVEPQRAHMVPGLREIQAAALRHGALGCSISGAGPSIFAIFSDRQHADDASADMGLALQSRGLAFDTYCSTINPEGAREVVA